jgi:hypothetical protein
MSSNILKLKFEGFEKLHEFRYKDEIAFSDQQRHFFDGVDGIESPHAYHLYNTETGLFILHTSELGTGKYIINSSQY